MYRVQQTRRYLVLEDGLCFPGYSFGGPGFAPDRLPIGSEPAKAAGEVVFNTAMSGYLEVLTDPSYTGQIVVMTYPHVGNYGVDREWSETGPEGHAVRQVVKPAGYVVRSLYGGPVPTGRMRLAEYLEHHRTPGITDVDTRALTLRLRDQGSANGVLIDSAAPGLGYSGPAGGTGATAAGTSAAETDAKASALGAGVPRQVEEYFSAEDAARIREFLASFPSMEGRDLISEVGSVESEVFNPSGSPHITLVDCGSKANILRELVARGCKVTLVPSKTDAGEIDALDPDAVLFSNGPGDPAVLDRVVATARGLAGKRPLFGICLGHQILSEAMGAKTYKMTFGHHGVNHPVRDEKTRRVFVTSQNHGFAVDETTLPEGTEVWFRNANDKSVEGIAHEELRIWTAQFHPESAPGPHDSRWIFDSFVSLATGTGSAPGGQSNREDTE